MSRSTRGRSTYAFCPSSPAAKDSLPEERIALDAFLRAHNFRPAWQKEYSPDLLVVAPPAPEDALAKSHMEPDHLRVFQQGARGRVLYVQPELTPTSPSGAVSDAPGVFIFGNRRSDDIAELSRWLLDESQRKTEAVEYISQGLELVFDTLYDETVQRKRARFLKYVQKEFPGSGVRRFPDTAPWWDILYALFHIAGSYDVLEHDLNRYARHSLSQEAKGHQKIRQKRETLNVAADLWSSLQEVDAFRRDAMGRKDQVKPCILVVDDNPRGIKDEITPVVAAMMPGYDILCWNPNEGNDRGPSDTFDRIIRYASLTADKDDAVGPRLSLADSETTVSRQSPFGRFLKMNEWSVSAQAKEIKETPKYESLDSALRRSRFVLVDLLFRHNGSEGEYGAALIRGLRRMCVDRQQNAKDGKIPLPRFIAFSRSDDLERIQRALRAGASGYVLKHRLLSLPAELARLRYGGDKSACLLHRNFHALDFLPNETHGLLHEVKIPRWRFDRRGHTETEHDSVHCRSEERKCMADLLRAIPKPDLHLHVGSCMTPEFLVIASILMLAEREEKISPLLDGLLPLFGFWLGKTDLKLADTLGGSPLKFGVSAGGAGAIDQCDPVHNLGNRIRSALKRAVRQDARTHSQSGKSLSLRSLLHEKLNIRDHWTVRKACEELDTKDTVSLMLFGIMTGSIEWDSKSWPCSKVIKKDDVLRLFILFWVSHYTENVRVIIAGQDIYEPLCKLKINMEQAGSTDANALETLRTRLVAVGASVDLQCLELPKCLALDVSLGLPQDLLRNCPSLHDSPLEFLIASGTRGRTLAEYLAGCEYAGAEHLRRPALMGLYARQTLEYLVRYGVLYAELRSAVSGYANKDKEKEGMTYQKACTTFQEAFGTEQEELMDAYRKAVADPARGFAARQDEQTHGWTWCDSGRGEGLWHAVFRNVRVSDPLKRLFPAKVNLIFTGKRHKATREMLMEAAAGVMLNSESKSEPIAASEFTSENMARCRVVGFDLAGLEESFPPEMFRAQFEQLSRMHIPITAHAGENASARFVESAVLDLRARRLGHGLALADDPKLMARVREERICIELCPVSNYQTNEFADAKPGREYPLKKFLDFGNIVCLNTDNPIVSYTNIVKEFFQASYAYGGDGLSLWDALRMIRMGFAHAFKGLAERRALIELVEQMIFDLLIDPSVVELLRRQAKEAETERAVQ